MDNNIIDKQFWAWTVLRTVNKNQREYLEVQCICGVKRVVRAIHIASGKSRSCGAKECTAEEKHSKNKIYGIFDRDPPKVGQQFGDLTVTSINPDNPKNITTTCTCGKVEQHTLKGLLTGVTTTCKKRQNRSKYIIDIGSVFGKLVVIEEAKRTGTSSDRYYKCLCECGNACIRRASKLINKTATHCGCSRAVITQKEKPVKTDHINKEHVAKQLNSIYDFLVCTNKK